MKVCIAGSRAITDSAIVDQAIADSGLAITEVVSGCCRGVDKLGEQWADRNGIRIVVFPADWKTHGPKAGPIRNRAMSMYTEALILIWTGESKGSASMLNFAIQRRLTIFEVLLLKDGTTRSRRHLGRTMA